LWDALHRRALWCTSEELIVRFCVQAADALVPYRGVSGVAGTVLLFKKDQFLSNFDGTWHQAFEIAAPIFHDFTNDQMSFTVAESCLSANYATNAKTVGRFKFNYDSKQHTVQVFVTETDKNSSPIVTGETAFRIVDLFESVELNWDQKGWRPLISGFIASKS